MNLFTKNETDPEQEAEHLTMVLMQKFRNGELGTYTLLMVCKRIYELGKETGRDET